MTANGKAPQEGVLICIYGPSKGGKTVASAAVGATGTFICDPSGLLSARKFLGLDSLKVIDASTVPTAIEGMRTVLASGTEPSIVIDDFSLMVEATINEYESSKGKGAMWNALIRDVMEIRDVAREAATRGTIVIFNCHEQPPRTSSGKFVRGGPSLPGQLPEKFSSMVDVIGRVVFEPTAAPWKYQLCFEPQPNYVCGDRLGVFPNKAPMNIAEGLRHAGYAVPYPEGMEWMPGIVEKLSQKILEEGIAQWRPLLATSFEKLSGSKPTHQIRWVLQDALHRATLIHHERVGIREAFTAPASGEEDPLFV